MQVTYSNMDNIGWGKGGKGKGVRHVRGMYQKRVTATKPIMYYISISCYYKQMMMILCI